MISTALDLTGEEFARLTAIAARQGLTVEALISKIARQQIVLAENLGARVAVGPGSVDTREAGRR
jgi:predicted DNA-binding ribbon-helix-helix protein